ncbi:MAG: rod shape-determining protein MreD [Spirochaetaceae bacterium]|nr:MAG: rod shape-determining protein MreD [Spirochaetaceae bacterium]
MTRQPLFLALLLVSLIALAQTVILDAVRIAGVAPDLVLLVLVFSAHKQGSMNGQMIGLVGGLVEDLTSLAPLGFNSLIRLAVGFLAGSTRNKMFLDPIFMPIILVTGATLFKTLLAALVIGVFGIETATQRLFGQRLWIELAYNAVLAPVVFALLNAIRPLYQTARGSRR